MPFLVRVIRSFEPATEDEINLEVDDVAQVQDIPHRKTRDERYWLRVFFDGHNGLFPRTNVVDVPLSEEVIASHLTPEGKAFVAKESFHPQEASDLGFKRGSVIIGTRKIDNNWWQGWLLYDSHSSAVVSLRKTGMFPVTHVYPLQIQSRSCAASSSTSSYSQSFRRGTVLVDMQPQLEQEIRLRKGNKAVIYSSHDDLYFRGESDGQVGIFPKTFVELDPEPIASASSSTLEVRGAEGGHEEDPPSYETALASVCPTEDSFPTQGISSYGMSLFPFQGMYANELTFKSGEIIHLIRHIDHEWMEGEVNGMIGIFPTSFIEIIVDVHRDGITDQDLVVGAAAEAEAESREDSLEIIETFPEDTYGRVLYDFTAEEDKDLSVKKGSTITLLRKFGDDWIEAMDDSSCIGLVPVSYIEVITDSENISSIPEDVTPNAATALMESPFSHHLQTEDSVQFDTDFDLDDQPVEQVSVESIPVTHLEVESELPTRPRSSNESAGNFSLRDITLSRPSPPRNNNVPIRPAPPRPAPPSTTLLSPTKIKDVASAFDPLNSSSNESSDKIGNGSVSNTSQESSQQSSSVKSLSKRNEQRNCILTELLQSEKDYIEHLKVCYSLLEKPAKDKEDFRLLLGNLDQVIEAASSLYSRLEDTIKNHEGKDVGKAFTSTADLTRQSYSRFCQNSKDTQSIWNKVSAENASSDVKVIVSNINRRIRDETNSYDLPSMLIKPIQRILKYPLLLSELIKTSSNPRETEQLQEALETMTKMASEINEYKRRKELVQKYRRVNSQDKSLSAKISRLTIHTVKKKSSRLGMKIYSKIGLASTTKDPVFDSLFLQFKSLEKTIKIFWKDLLVLMENQHLFLKYSHDFVQSVVDFYAGKSNIDEVILLLRTHKEIWETIWSEMKKLLKFNVLEVIETLLKKFEGPNHLIAKRNDKCADYDSTSRSRDTNATSRTRNEDEVKKKNDFEALNAQLIDELPALIELSTEIFNNCLAAFFKIKKIFIGKTAKSLLDMLESQPVMISSSAATSAADIQETFNVKFNLLLEDLSRDFNLLSPVLLAATHHHPHSRDASTSRGVSGSRVRGRSSSPAIEFPPRPSPSSVFGSSSQAVVPQTTNDREKILKEFRPQDIFVAVQDYQSLDKMDVSVRKGDIVGVIRRRNPMGSDQQWFVDTGLIKGFLPSKIIHPYTATQVHVPPLSTPKSRGMSVDSGVMNVKGNQRGNLLTFDDNRKLRPQSTLDEFDPLGPSASNSSNSSVDSGSIKAFDDLADVLCPATSSSTIDSATARPTTSSSHKEQKNESSETYVAMYPFNATAEGTLNLHVGQFVQVKARSDLTGNSEWFLVEDPVSGKKGYVPANYILPFSQVRRT